MDLNTFTMYAYTGMNVLAVGPVMHQRTGEKHRDINTCMITEKKKTLPTSRTQTHCRQTQIEGRGAHC